MGQSYGVLGFVTIVFLYGVIGVMAAKGTIGVFQKILPPKSEQFFYGIFLILVGAAAWTRQRTNRTARNPIQFEESEPADPLPTGLPL